MKKIRVLFEQEPTLDEIEVTVRASERAAEVIALLERVNGRSSEPLVVTDTDGALIKIDPDDVARLRILEYRRVFALKSRRFLYHYVEKPDSLCYNTICTYNQTLRR